MASSGEDGASVGIEGQKVTLPRGVCVKVASLRPRYDNLQEWCTAEGNVLVTRRGRVFIKDRSSGTSTVYSYKGSEWANPFKLSNHSLAESLRKYRKHLEALVEDEERRKRFLDLANAKELGCFCAPGSDCHRDVIISLLRDLTAENSRKRKRVDDATSQEEPAKRQKVKE